MTRKTTKSILLVTILVLVVALVIPASAKDSGRTPSLIGVNPRGAEGPSVAGGDGPYAMGGLLYDQTTTLNGYGGIAMHATETGDLFQLADEFEVPAGYVWNVDGIVMPGFWYFDDPTTTTGFVVEFLMDDAGAPGTVYCIADVDTYTLTLTEATVEFSTNPCVLPEGTYWVTGYPEFDSTGGFFFLWYIWYWANVTPGAGSDGYFRDVYDYFGTGCTDWSPAVPCGFTYADMAFALYGTEGSAEPPLTYPNKGEILISAGSPVMTYGAAGDYPTGIVLPQDYDGNGFDTYIITKSVEVAGEMWYGIFMGGDTWVYVRASEVTILR